MLPRCLDSVLGQTYTNLEIILIDDGSPDGCGAICDAYAEKDSRIRVVHQQNAGIGRTRNVGLSHCTGDYITFVDSDDHLFPDSIRQLHDRAHTDGSDMVIGNCIRTYEDGTESGPCYTYDDTVLTADDLLDRLSVFGAIHTASWNKLYTRHCLEGVVYPDARIGEDTIVFPQIIDRCTRISMINAPLYGYFQREDSLMQERSESSKVGDINAILYIARYLWDHHRYHGAANWYAAAAKNGLTIRSRRARLAEFRSAFDRRTRNELRRRMDRKGRIAWLCLHIPLADRLFRRLFSKNAKKA